MTGETDEGTSKDPVHLQPSCDSVISTNVLCTHAWKVLQRNPMVFRNTVFSSSQAILQRRTDFEPTVGFRVFRVVENSFIRSMTTYFKNQLLHTLMPSQKNSTRSANTQVNWLHRFNCLPPTPKTVCSFILKYPGKNNNENQTVAP